MLPIEKFNFDPLAGVPEIVGVAVDLAVLAGYERVQMDGEPDLIVELIDLYVEDAPRRVTGMQESLARRNWISVKREAHGLKGSSGSLGALEMARICNQIEEIESTDPNPGITALLGGLELELERVLHIFLAERQRRSQ